MSGFTSLGVRQADVLRHYFGLGGRERLPLGEIGGLYGLTRERIRQIRNQHWQDCSVVHADVGCAPIWKDEEQEGSMSTDPNACAILSLMHFFVLV